VTFPPPFRAAVAQTSPALGDLEKNLDACATLAESAAADGVRLIVFPELAATGYFLKDMVPDVALARDDARLERFLELSRRIAIVIGLVEISRDFAYYNSAFWLEGGEIRGAHRKVYLPTYGLFDEARYLAGGGSIRAFDTQFGRAAILVCEDMWHLSAPYIAVQDGAQLLICPAASPLRGVPGGGAPVPADTWQAMNRTYARLLGAHVLFANRVGFEDGVGFWGGSEIVAPDGATLARAPYFDESLVTAEIDARAVRRERLVTPLFRDERLGLTVRELSRLLAGDRKD
jgi:predicted amidohydrolase